MNYESFNIGTDMQCERCGQKILSREKFLSELNKHGLSFNQHTNSITLSGAFSSHSDIDKLRLLSQKFEEMQALKCNTCNKIYCLMCLLNYAPFHPTSGGKACFNCNGSISYAYEKDKKGDCFIATTIKDAETIVASDLVYDVEPSNIEKQFVCFNCNSTEFEYDSFLKETNCKECGWIKKDNDQSETAINIPTAELKTIHNTSSLKKESSSEEATIMGLISGIIYGIVFLIFSNSEKGRMIGFVIIFLPSVGVIRPTGKKILGIIMFCVGTFVSISIGALLK